MNKIQVGIFGFGRTGKIVVNEFIKDGNFILKWVVRRSHDENHKYSSTLLGYEHKEGEIFSIDDIDDLFYEKNNVDIIIDFANSKAVQFYKKASDNGIKIISAISKYEENDYKVLDEMSSSTAVLYSPNITLGINFLLIASQVLQKIAPHADIEIIEEHFREKQEISGTAKKIARALELNQEQHINSIRVGGIVGKHEIVFGLPNQTIRLTHESINRAAFGQGAIFAAKWLINQPNGLYSMEQIISDMFMKNTPVY